MISDVLKYFNCSDAKYATDVKNAIVSVCHIRISITLMLSTSHRHPTNIDAPVSKCENKNVHGVCSSIIFREK